MGPTPRHAGISRSGADAEALFRQLPGAIAAPRAALGDAVLDGHYVEVKNANSSTLNQVRAVKYITLVVFSAPVQHWYVIPANEIVRQCARKQRGQHTENPFESATLSLSSLTSYVLADATTMRAAVLAAVAEAERFPKLKELMDRILSDSRTLAARSVADVQVALSDYGLV